MISRYSSSPVGAASHAKGRGYALFEQTSWEELIACVQLTRRGPHSKQNFTNCEIPWPIFRFHTNVGTVYSQNRKQT